MTSTNLRLFYKLFDGVSKALTIFGLSYIERCQQSSAYRLSYKRLVYGLVICLLVLFIFHQQITRFFPKENDRLLILLTLYMSVVSTLMAMLMIATAAYNAPALARLLNNPEYFEVFSLESYSFVKFNTIRQFSFCFFVLVACYLSDFLAENDFSVLPAVKIMMFFFFPMYNSFCISELFVYQYWLQRWYWNINESLRQMANGLNLSVFAVEEMAKCLRIGTGHPVPVFDSDSLLAGELVRLRRVYHQTYKVARNLDTIYSLRHVLLLIHHSALEIIYTYWGLRHTLQNFENFRAILNFYKAAFMSFVSVVSMVWPCTTTRVEAQKTCYLVQDLLATVKDGEARTEVQIFALQLLQERYEFSPHGFFELDTKLLLSLLATGTSYLVVLLQYHMVYIALHGDNQNTNATLPCSH